MWKCNFRLDLVRKKLPVGRKWFNTAICDLPNRKQECCSLCRDVWSFFHLISFPLFSKNLNKLIGFSYAIPFSTLTRQKLFLHKFGRHITSSCINMWVVYGATWQLSVKLNRKPNRRRPNFVKTSHDDTAAHITASKHASSKEAGLPIHKPSLNTTIILATRDETSPFTLVMELVEFPNTLVNFYDTTRRHIPESGFPISRPNLEHDH
jgi:hypothetical protein